MKEPGGRAECALEEQAEMKRGRTMKPTVKLSGVLLSCAFLGACIPEPKFGFVSIGDNKSAREQVVFATTLADGRLADDDKYKVIGLTATCINGRMGVKFEMEDELKDEMRATKHILFDAGVRTQLIVDGEMSEDSRTLEVLDTRQAIPFLNSLYCKKDLRVEFPRQNHAPLSVLFRLKDINTGLGPTRLACRK